jgi:isopentenyl phosphate kinase
MSITLVKLGGSLITDKRVEASYRADLMEQIAAQLSAVIAERPEMPMIIGHGSGSFGHFAAHRYGTITGVYSREQWRGFAEVAAAAAELNYLVAKTLRGAGIPVWRIQPSASMICRDGMIVHMALEPLQAAIQQGIIPLVYGDVAIDTVRGGTIASTETIFTYLVQQLPVTQVLLLGEVSGVYDATGKVIAEITRKNFNSIQSFIGGSSGTDVTGGMLTKVSDMLALTEQFPGLKVRILDGTIPDLIRQSLLDEVQSGTLIYSG